MKQEDLKNLRNKYVELRNSLIQTIEKSDYEVDVAGESVDKLQGANLLRIQNQLSIKNLNRLRAIDRSLELIDMGDYGDCEECGDPISFRRLEAIPGVTLCVSCAEEAEAFR